MKLKSAGLIILFLMASLLLPNSSVQAAQEGSRPRGIIYMAAEVGCYSATYISSRSISMVAPKKVYPVPCTQYHHYEVFWTGKFKTRPGNLIPNSKESANFCLGESKKLKYYERDSRSYNHESGDNIGIGNWLADKGPEAARFPKRLVCYVGLTTNEFRTFKQVDQPLIRGSA